MTSRSSTAAPLLAVLAVVLATLGAYVGGYFWLPVNTLSDPTWRIYRHRWQADVFEPAGRVEEWLTGSDITVCCFDDMTVIE